MINLVSLNPSDYDALYHEYHKTKLKNSPKIILNPGKYLNLRRKNTSPPKDEILPTEVKKYPKYLPKINNCFHSNQVTLESSESIDDKKNIFSNRLVISKKFENGNKIKNKPKLKPLSIKKVILREKSFKLNKNNIDLNSKSNRPKKIYLNINNDKIKKPNEFRQKLLNKAYEKEKQLFQLYCLNNNEVVINQLVIEFFRRTKNNKVPLGDRGKVITDFQEPKINESYNNRNLSKGNYKHEYKSLALLPKMNRNLKESDTATNNEIDNKNLKESEISINNEIDNEINNKNLKISEITVNNEINSKNFKRSETAENNEINNKNIKKSETKKK